MNLCDDALSRRHFMTAGLTAGIASVLGPAGCGKSAGPYGGYELGMATWGFRFFNGPEVVAMTKQLGATCIDLTPSVASFDRTGKRIRGVPAYEHNPDNWKPLKAAMEQHGVRCDTYGPDLSEDMDANRYLFEWLKQENINCLRVASPPEMLEKVEPLVEQYDIPVVVHNHGPTDKHYQKITALVDALKDRHPLIGACVDVGHFWRGGEDPVEALEALGDRVLRVHLKDQASVKEQAIVGEGKLDIPAILRTLIKINYSGPLHLEYEDHPDDPMPHIEKCLANMRRMFEELG